MRRIIFLNGVGSSGEAMWPLAEALGATDKIQFPDGPQSFDMGRGRQWFSVNGITEENWPARIAAVMPGRHAGIWGLGKTRRSVLIGFSEGAIMALHAVSSGQTDRLAIETEPFRQWVIQDHCAGPRPAREKSGAPIVADVAPYEVMKCAC